LSPRREHRVGRSALLRAFFRLLGKSEEKVVAVFGSDPATTHRTALYVREGAPNIPLWLYATAAPRTETAALCGRVVVRRNPLALFLQAQGELWRYSVALAAGAWTGRGGGAILKLAPILTPPFRAVLANENGDFLSANGGNIARHLRRRMADWLRDRVADWVVSKALARCGPWFRKLHGAGHLHAPAPVDEGSGVAWYRGGGDWDGEALERMARTSDARWIAWSREGPAPIGDMLETFAGKRVFAVSRQEHHRTWRIQIYPMAPFRTLQAGEASQVLAPVSGTIVVDRAKLLALGVPRCKRALTAWLLLFWKAAAAGWRSYSMGGGSRASQQPDFPLETGAFLYQALADGALRKLGPQEANLSRGNVAFEPCEWSGNPRRSDRPRVLVVSPFLPYPLSHGGAVRMFNLCRALSRRVDFALVAVHESRETVHYDKLREVFQKIRVVDMDEPVSADTRLPAQVRQHQSQSLWETVSLLAEEWEPDVLQVEYTHMAHFRDAAPDTPAILVEHDLTFSLYGQLADSDGTEESRREYARWLEFERRWLRDFDGVWAVSEQDREAAIREGSRPEFTFTVPNGVDIFRFMPEEAATEKPEILFVGSFRHLPNVIAFQKFRSEIMPRVWRIFPGAVGRVVAGPDHEWFWRKLAPNGAGLTQDPRIQVHGFVEDLRPLYARAAAVAAPLEVSAGTNIKVLEAMACGKAIVSTPAGCGGLGLRHGEEALIRADWADFAGALCETLANPALRNRLGRQARLEAERRFSWNAIQEEAYRSYELLRERQRMARAAVGD